MDRVKLVRAIRQLASAIEDMSDSDLEAFFGALSAGQLVPRTSSRRSLPRSGKADVSEMDDLLSNLRAANSREVAHAYLDNLRLTRLELTRMARRADVHITKQDNVAVIEEKLVEALVGARLNSLAIRGERPKSDASR